MGLQLGTQNHQVQQSKRTFLFSRMDVEKELFAAYAFYAGIVTLKMLIMSPLTARQRFKTNTFISSEDAVRPGTKTGIAEDVERVRRCHQNDIENILPFLILGFLYIFTNPAYSTALFVYRLFVGARLLLTFVYLFVIPQPARALLSSSTSLSISTWLTELLSLLCR